MSRFELDELDSAGETVRSHGSFKRQRDAKDRAERLEAGLPVEVALWLSRWGGQTKSSDGRWVVNKNQEREYTLIELDGDDMVARMWRGFSRESDAKAAAEELGRLEPEGFRAARSPAPPADPPPPSRTEP